MRSLAIVGLSTQDTPEVTAPLDLFNRLFDASEDGKVVGVKGKGGKSSLTGTVNRFVYRQMIGQ